MILSGLVGSGLGLVGSGFGSVGSGPGTVGFSSHLKLHFFSLDSAPLHLLISFFLSVSLPEGLQFSSFDSNPEKLRIKIEP